VGLFIENVTLPTGPGPDRGRGRQACPCFVSVN
jgi:hypothetical protein